MRVLRDLDSADFALFTSLCRFCWHVGNLEPLIYEPNDALYRRHGIDFNKLNDLMALGLVSFSGVAGFSQEGMGEKFTIGYGQTRVEVTAPNQSAQFDLGHVLFTDAGRRLAALTHAQIIPEFLDYALNKMRNGGFKADVV